ncbi:MAG TPA: DUF3488 and transglutaminase-like domain-containing protein, partial [Actinotalea sp.]|nr:DUF3488 and transglutaminase-like domain-containing protein [Actinotalea sp.]
GGPAGSGSSTRDGLATVLVAGSVLLAVWGWHGLLAPGPWWPVSAATVLVLAGVTTAVRRTGRSRGAPTLVALGLAGAVGLVAYGGLLDPSGEWGPSRLVALVHQGVRTVVTGVIPVQVTPGLTMLLLAAVVVAFLLTDLLALGLGRPALSGLPVAALWAVPVTFGLPVPAPAVVVGGTCYLLLLWLAGPAPGPGPRAAGPGRPDVATVVPAGALATLALLGGPVAAASPWFGTVRLPGWGTGDLGPLSLSTSLDLRSSLSPRSDRTVLTYTTTSNSLGPLRTQTLVAFDGTRWDTSPPGGLTEADGELWPSEAPSGEVVEEVLVRVGDLDEDRLPIPTDPRTVTVGPTWRYDPERDEVVGRGTSTLNLTYRVLVRPRDLSAAALASDVPQPLPADAPELAVPDTGHAQDTADLAAEVTAGASTAYDQALALQGWFRNAGTFRYETRIPPGSTDDAVWDFLERRSGYCVQYATAMVVMARTLGIPARMGIGFLPGTPRGSDPDTFVVAARQAHAWPELWFADAGWVRFEPTPAVQTGPLPSYADPFLAAPTTTPTAEPTVEPSRTSTAAPAPGAASPGAGTPTGDGRPWLALAALGALAGGLSVAAVLRHRRGAVRALDAEASWSRLRVMLAAHGVVWSDATTPRQAAELIRSSWPGSRPAGVEGPAVGHRGEDRLETARTALAGLVLAVEEARYAPEPHLRSAAELDGWVRAVVEPWAQVSPGRPGGGPSAPRDG